MNPFALILAFLHARIGLTLLNVLLLASSVAMITVLLVAGRQLESRFERDAAGFDLVIGAKGSALQTVLANVFHLDVPTGNIPLAAAEEIASDPQVKSTIPLALGDSFRGFRIVGTDPSYLEHYGATFAQGSVWSQPLQAVLGSEAAVRTGLTIGGQFAGSHGLAEGGAAHGDQKYTVTGVLKPTGSVLDRLILTAVDSVWAVHEAHHQPAGAGPEADHDHAPHEITALLVRYATPLAAATLPRRINQETKLTAASPALETGRLMSLIGASTDALRWLGVALAALAAVSIFVALNASLALRTKDLMLLRLMGATRLRVATLLVGEGVLLAVAGVILGLAAGHLAVEAMGVLYGKAQQIALTGRVWYAEEWLLVAVALSLGAVAALFPAWSAYRLDMTRALVSA